MCPTTNSRVQFIIDTTISLFNLSSAILLLVSVLKIQFTIGCEQSFFYLKIHKKNAKLGSVQAQDTNYFGLSLQCNTTDNMLRSVSPVYHGKWYLILIIGTYVKF